MKTRTGKSAAPGNIRPAIFLLPSLLGILCFYLLPFLIIFVYSFFDDPLRRNDVGLGNYASLLRNHAFLLALKNTVLFLAGAVGVTLLVSLVLALLLRRLLARSGLMKAALALPLTVPVATTVILAALLLDWYGALNGLLRGLGLSPVNWLDGIWARRSMILLYLWKHCGLFTLLIAAALETVPKDEREAALLDGAGGLQMFFSIELHHIAPALLFVVLAGLLLGFRFFREIVLLCGRYPPEDLYLVQHFMRNVFALLDYQKLCAGAVVLFLLAALGMGIPALLVRRFSGDGSLLPQLEPSAGRKDRRFRAGDFLPTLILLLCALPTLLTLVHSLTGEGALAERYAVLFDRRTMIRTPIRLLLWPEEPTLGSFRAFFARSELFRAYGRSLLYALPALAVQLPISLCAAWGFARLRGKLRNALLLLYMILLLLPWEVTLVPNFFVARWLGLLETPWAVWLPSAFSPLPVYLLTQYFRRLPPELREAAELDGAGEWQVFARVSLPNIRPALGAVAYLSFIDLWNMVELPRTLLRREDLQPLSVTLASIRADEPIGPVFAASLLYLLVPLGAVLLLRRKPGPVRSRSFGQDVLHSGHSGRQG